MLRMRTKLTLIAAAVAGAIAGAMPNTASANINLTATQVTLGGNANSNALNTNGWVAYIITATPDAASNKISTMDMASGVNGIFVTNGLHQQWNFNFDPDSGDPLPDLTTPIGTIPSTTTVLDSRLNNLTAGNLGTGYNFAVASGGSPTEDNNGTNGPNPPYNRSPLTDGGQVQNGLDFGVGSFLKEAISFNDDIAGGKPQPDTAHPLQLAYIVVPQGVPVTITVKAQFSDHQAGGGSSTFQDSLIFVTGVVTPEPASLGVLALGGLALLARRRKA